jgi:hypothetical protein
VAWTYEARDANVRLLVQTGDDVPRPQVPRLDVLHLSLRPVLPGGVAPVLVGRSGERIGFLTFTYIYKGKPVSSARYKYNISRSTGHSAKQGTDEYFNYCVKQHPETVVSSGGVLQCFVPGNTLIAYRRV